MAGIFKAYDIRGVYGEALNQDMGYKIGLSFANFLGAGKTIACGKDRRSSSDELQAAFIDGARDGGLNVVNMGLCTTPTTYYACFSDHYDGAVMITASHNPGKYNGLKFCGTNAVPIGHAEGLDKVETAIREGNLTKAETRGTLSEKDYKEGYLNFLKEKSTYTRKFNLAVDAGNGMGGYLIQDYLDKVGQEAVALYWDLDFNFPNHEANPLDFNTLKDLQKAVTEGGLDFGVAFDGDADRCFFVDDRGDVVPADILTTLIAKNILAETGGGAIIYDVRSSKVVAEVIEEMGGTPILCRVGHSFMKARLRKEEGPFGGELAGHFYFRDFAYADSAFLTMITVMNIIDKEGKPLSELITPFRKYAPSGEINFITEKADAFLAEAADKFPGGELLTVDGVRLDYADWWFSLRKSNTEPLLRLVVEGDNHEVMEEKVAAIKDWLVGGGAEIH
ncbi:MAG: phosphomannomutase/phosphoglucomutase [Acidobacteriota bacterium]|nr:phosphomannomutase/phosphoglucomutase [Acidobacteriota bacterium]